MLERLTDHILFVAEYEQRAYAQKIGNPTCPWSINYNGLSDEEFEPVAPADGAADFLFLGELRILKGPDLFLNALAGLHRAGNPNVRAVMVGDGPDAAGIKALTHNLGLDEAVRFLAPMPARQAFALARVLAMPSRAEALPYVVLEALGANMPIIATGVGGIPEIFGADNPAMIAPEAGDLARLMGIALAEPETLARWMPERAVLKARFSARTMAGNVLKAYRGALTLRAGQAGKNSALSSVS
jgi:glycosyltransferase involved in cell wall biosynthesis